MRPRRLPRRIGLLALAAGLVAASPAPDVVSTGPYSTDPVVVEMVFPVVGGASYTDTWLACRDGCTRLHLGQDLMAPKMRPLVAVFNGTVSYLKRETRPGEGNYVSLRGADGWSVDYVHVNNDTPGTDDGLGTACCSFAPGLAVGSTVVQGQLLGWVGDSGNAESTAPHCHFELHRGDAWSGTAYNPKASLDIAPRLSAPRHPARAFAPRRSLARLGR